MGGVTGDVGDGDGDGDGGDIWVVSQVGILLNILSSDERAVLTISYNIGRQSLSYILFFFCSKTSSLYHLH